MLTLSHLGIGLSMLSRTSALYNSPSAQLQINGTLSEPFALHNGTRQGCPLSPILFALWLEPFLLMVRNNLSIHGIKTGTTEHKYTAYTDNILFYVQRPIISLPNLMSAFTMFGAISDFKMNLSKSEILNL